ncbi:hypothetical protein QEN19_003958 [Hanseniaspora menglaensis]
MKEKLTALDLEILVNELEQNLVGLRLNNIYNVQENNKQFLLKFQKPDVKQNLVIDCGLKLYVTKFSRNTPTAPSGFIVKLRSFLSNKKLTGLKKIENERTIVLQFSNGMFYLVLEFFSSGNLLVLDESLKILQVFRVNEEHNVKIGEYYNLFNPLDLFGEDVEDSVATNPSFNYLENDLSKINETYLKKIFKNEEIKVNDVESLNNKKFKILSISKLLYLNYPTFTNQLIQDKLKLHGINSSESCVNYFNSTAETLENIINILSECAKEIKSILIADKSKRIGYLTKRINPAFLKSEEENSETNPEYLYDTYSPFKPSDENALFDVVSGGYVSAIDKFYSTLELLKTSTKTNNFISQQQKKLEQTKMENDKRVEQLETFSVSNEIKGNAIIENVDIVEELIEIMKNLIINNQMDWKAIELWIQNQQKKRKSSDAIQKLQLPLNLGENKFKVSLPIEKTEDSEDTSESESDVMSESDDSDSDVESCSDSETDLKTVKKKKEKKKINETSIWIDFTLSAYNNATNYFQTKKELQSKKSKTLANQQKAIKSIEHKFNKNLNKKLKESTQPLITKLREPFFFQKFNWFITTDGYLAILLNDDMIYWKYAEDNDFYLNSNNTIATKNSQVLVKNLRNEDALSERAILEISQFSLTGSEAWNKKISSASCFYCKINNISKFANDDYEKNGVLDNAKFYIKDENKLINLLPVQLVMGFGLLWRKKLKNNNIEYVEQSVETTDSVVEEVNLPLLEDSKAFLKETATNDTELENLSEEDDVSESYSIPEKENHKSAIANALDEFDELSSRSQTPISKKEKKKLNKKTKTSIPVSANTMNEDSLKRFERSKQIEEKARYQNMKVKKLMNMKKPKVHYDLMLKELSPVMKLSQDDEQNSLYEFELVPMFAPWMALSKSKFKIKIQNGTLKKLKNCNDIMMYFEGYMKIDSESKDKDRIWPKELELIREFPTEGLVTSFFIDKFKLSAPGSNNGSNGGNKAKKGKKKSK